MTPDAMRSDRVPFVEARREGAVSRALSREAESSAGLRTGTEHRTAQVRGSKGARTAGRPDVAGVVPAHGALEAVVVAGGADLDQGELAAGVDRRDRGEVHARVVRGGAAFHVRLGGGNLGADVGLRRPLLRLLAEAEVRRNGDREQDADDDQDD